MTLLDTNVLSALMQREPEARVVAWLDAQPPDLGHLELLPQVLSLPGLTPALAFALLRSARSFDLVWKPA